MLLRAVSLSLVFLLLPSAALAEPTPEDTPASNPDDEGGHDASENDASKDAEGSAAKEDDEGNASDEDTGEEDTGEEDARKEQPGQGSARDSEIPAKKRSKLGDRQVVRASDLPDDWVCSSDGMRDVLADAAPLLVQIDTRFDRVLGFAYFSDYHVLTTFSAVFWVEGLQVILPDGTFSTARVVAHDSDADLALLELERPISHARLTVGPPARVGEPVYAVGRTTAYGEGDPAIYPGAVTSIGEGRFGTDALDHPFFKHGGPVLDCEGRLVGIAGGMWGERAIPIAKARSLTRLIGKQPIYRGPAVTPHVEIGGVFQADDFALGGGFGLGLALTGVDGWEVKLKGGLVLLSELGGEEKIGMRVFGQTLGGYRLWLDEQHDFSLSAGAGLTLAYEQFCKDTCDNSEQNPPVLVQTRLMPTLEVGFQLWPATLSAQYQLDVDNSAMSVGQLLLGVEF